MENIAEIVKKVLATGENYVFKYDHTKQCGFPNAGEIVFVRGIKKPEKIKMKWFKTNAYTGEWDYTHTGTNLMGIDEISEIEDIFNFWIKGWNLTKEEIETEKETLHQRNVFYHKAESRLFIRKIGDIDRWSNPLPKDDKNLHHFIASAYLDAIQFGDIVLDIHIEGRQYGEFKDAQFNGSIRLEQRGEVVCATFLDKLEEDTRPEKIKIRYGHSMDLFVEELTSFIQDSFENSLNKE